MSAARTEGAGMNELEIKMGTAYAEPITDTMEWYVPLMDWYGQGTFWAVGNLTKDRCEAEMQIRNSCTPVVQARIIRVVLPCRAIP